MTYLLSLVTAKSPSKGSAQILCYYMNNTSDNKIIRVMSGVVCHFERFIFPKERILFTALPESYLEIYSSLGNRSRLNKIDCKLLQVNEKSNLDPTL